MSGLGKAGKGSQKSRGMCRASLFPSQGGKRRGGFFRVLQHCYCQEKGNLEVVGIFSPTVGT